jgi:hypothetical protein
MLNYSKKMPTFLSNNCYILRAKDSKKNYLWKDSSKFRQKSMKQNQFCQKCLFSLWAKCLRLGEKIHIQL